MGDLAIIWGVTAAFIIVVLLLAWAGVIPS